jgi:hypothetical protein
VTVQIATLVSWSITNGHIASAGKPVLMTLGFNSIKFVREIPIRPTM